VASFITSHVVLLQLVLNMIVALYMTLKANYITVVVNGVLKLQTNIETA